MGSNKLLDEIAGLNIANDALRGLLAEAEIEVARLKVMLEYAIADIPRSCHLCMSKRCAYVCECEGCEDRSHWHWYGAIGG